VRTGILLVALLAFNGAAVAQDTNAPGGIPAPKDVPYTGTIRLDVDATDTIRHIFGVHETIPVMPGSSVTLLYPRWLPGNHSPSGRIEQLTGLAFRAGGARLEWARDPVDVYAFHVQVPSGVSAVDADFQVATATDGDQGRMVITPDMLNLQWNEVALYPAGFYARQIAVQPAVKLPPGWQFATALETQSSGTVTLWWIHRCLPDAISAASSSAAHRCRSS
jgi:predicted metalloprotease with PDZ domain